MKDECVVVLPTRNWALRSVMFPLTIRGLWFNTGAKVHVFVDSIDAAF